MTTNLPRRALLAAGAMLAAPAPLRAQAAMRLVVIGGGFGGASAASFARRAHPDVQVTLVEPQPRFVTCPYGNLLLGGERQIGQITHSYDGLRARGVTVVQDRAAGIDAVAKTVRLAGGQTLAYDRLILSPGIALRWGAIEGYDQAAADIMPHAWVPADGAQTLLLRRQLEAMPDGGVVGIAIPPNPFRCPPGPYERISMIAHYLSRHKPRSKILALDAKEAFSKQGLFQDGWAALYPGMIEWVPGNRDGKVVKVDVRERVLETEFGTRHKVDVANVIAPQSAAALAIDAGLANDTGWVPVNARTFEARAAAGIHVIGDANIPGPMPKSGFIANTTSKQAVAAAVALHRGQPVPEPVYFNTCYSHVGQDYGISVVNIFRPNADGTAIAEVPNSGGVSPRGNLPDQRRAEALHADAWYDSITRSMFG
ncbi:FCSD flavin-binding domain-containing protein [Roseomonas sp. CECT 9278]|uniref:FCSD flavin-binding domain-containing protein n=1 Tax=Roseomonas sp. CECT 9278 TaxID=2845823 RepID=UPI001E362C22|nr:NAD(P)/FAD-dependent oxidoreductase [Roseomonas sp. CECT 9278]CAH0285642.1 Sulfide dehydrogenase [flavocytochrome c] flavoprotein chain [Roseomonas sp. CECT 9278]